MIKQLKMKYKEFCCDDISVELVLKMEFNYVEDVDAFYNIYIRFVGSSVRKGDKNIDKEGIYHYQKWFCFKERFRHKSYIKMPKGSESINQ